MEVLVLTFTARPRASSFELNLGLGPFKVGFLTLELPFEKNVEQTVFLHFAL